MKLLWISSQAEKWKWPTWLSCELRPGERASSPALLQEDVLAFAIEIDEEFSTAQKFLREARDRGVLALPLVFTRKPDLTRLRTLIEERLCWGILWPGLSEKQRFTFFENLRLHHKGQSARRLALESARQQNRKLEELRQNLESAVEERTQSESAQKKETEARLAQVRELVRFVKDLSGCVAVEELLVLLRRELRRFHRVGEPILSYRSSGRARHLWWQGGAITERPVSRAWPENLRIRINEHVDSQYLADEFGRPFAKVVVFPLPALKGPTAGLAAPAVLFFEHSLEMEDVDPFIDHVTERLQSLSIALDRMILEQELRTTSALWEKTFDGLQDPVAIVDLDYNLLRANRRFGEQLNPVKCYKEFADREEPCLGCPLGDTLSSGKSVSSQVRRFENFYLAHSYPIRLTRDGESTTVVNHYLDVTNERQLQSRMIQTEKMAALGHLAGHIAHELNNPLTGIRSLVQVLRGDSKLKPELNSDLGEVEAAAERCQRIIQNLLSFTKGGEARRWCDLNDLVRRTLPFLKTALGEHRVDLELSEGTLGVYVEPHLMQQVIFNIVNNACQAMGKGGDIRMESRLEGQEVTLEVTDSGPGIPLDLQGRIFEPFFTTKGEEEGTGLGLSLSRQIVEGYGGTIGVRSALNQGSTFWIHLPLKDSQ